MIRKVLECGCEVIIATHYQIKYCATHKGDVNLSLFAWRKWCVAEELLKEKFSTVTEIS